MTPEKTLQKLVYHRAGAAGIQILRGTDPRMGGSSRGRRSVVMPNGRVYDYRDSIVSIGIRIKLITDQEVRDTYLTDPDYIACPFCAAITTRNGFYATYGYCGNCSAGAASTV